MLIQNHKEIVERTSQSLELLFLNSKEMQNQFAKFNDNKLSFAKEYCTVKLTTARKSGHTTAIRNLIEKYSIPSMIIAYNTAIMNRNFKKFSQDFNTKNNSKLIYLSTINTFDNAIRGISIQAIFVDIFSMLNHSQIEKIYKFGLPAMRHSDFYFFFVQ